MIAPVTNNTRVDISRALSIRGWMSEAELTWLAHQARNCRTVVEIGTYAGRSARAIGDHLLDNGVLFCIDPYINYVSEPEIFDTSPSPDDVMREAFYNLRDLILTGKIITIRGYSQEQARKAEPHSIDMVFIDGDHSYTSVFRDIESWLPKVKSGGLLCGHDYNVHDGVTRAVNDLFDSRGFGLPAGSIWSVRVE